MQFLVKPFFWGLIVCFSSCFLFKASAQTTVHLIITFDNYPEETSWEITSGGNIVNSGGPYGSQGDGSTLDIPISLNPGSYILIMKDSYGDGMCCNHGNGTYTLYAPGNVVLATWSAFSTTQSTSFTISGGCSSNTLPTITLSATPTSITGSGTVSLSANASDVDGTINRVEFYRNNVLIATDNTSPYSYVHSESTVGTHSFTAKAVDNCTGVTTSSAINVVVSSSNPCTSNPPPTVSINQPANNATVTAGTNLQITASASDNGTVTQVQFYNGTTLLGTSITSPFGYTYTSIPAGTYTLTARATDNCGAMTTSSVVTITVSSGGGSTCNPWTLNCTTTGDISRTGRVGIGTSNFLGDASYMLYVKGGIRAEKMQLEMSAAGGWSDYVFAPDYRLMPLKQVAEYLKTHRHLPGMASEAEMIVEGGINVGKIAAQQQAKIEELFLYVIELSKKVETLQEQVEDLQKENKALKINLKKH